MKKMLFIINPVAGKKLARSKLFDVLEVFCEEGFEVTTQITQQRGHGTELAASAKEKGYDIVSCIGGDGTLNEIISGVIASGSDIPIGYIPAGSTNDFAETLGISLIPAEAARNIARENTRTVDIGCFDEKRYFSYIASFGAFTATSYSTPQSIKNMLGHTAYVLEGVKDIGSIKAHKVSGKAGDREFSGKYIFGAVSNTTSVGGIVKLREDSVLLNDGLFEVLLIKAPKTPLDLNNIITGIFLSKFDSDVFEFFKTSELELNMGKTIPWTLDGEKATASSGTVFIKNLPEAITILK